MQENYLAKWLNGELSEAERVAFENADEFETLERIRKASETLKAPEFEMEIAGAALRNRRELNSQKVIQLRPFKKFFRVAAVAAVLLIGFYLFKANSDTSVSTAFAEHKEIRLPDLSKVVLNADSRVAFNEKNWEEERKVSLKGEAFFKVAKGKRFTVETAAGDIEVLGTDFSVEQRPDFFKVACFEGSVRVSFNDMKLNLSPQQSFVVINGAITETTMANTPQPAWLHNESSFKSVPLKFVLAEFERQHDLKVTSENIDLEQRFTGTFSNTDPTLALQSISVPSQIKFKFEGDKVLFYGEESK